ncbi:MAG: WXG100 family type VII secretion target [bacterium]|nr:WXG100 family type VII secretion target [bacterium]
MTGRYQISMDFEQAKRKANELERVAGDLGRLAGTEFNETLNNLGNNWKGDNAQAYIKKGLSLKERMEQTAAALRDSASMIRAVAKNIYDAEMEALRIAEEREAAIRLEAEQAAQGGMGGR